MAGNAGGGGGGAGGLTPFLCARNFDAPDVSVIPSAPWCHSFDLYSFFFFSPFAGSLSLTIVGGVNLVVVSSLFWARTATEASRHTPMAAV